MSPWPNVSAPVFIRCDIAARRKLNITVSAIATTIMRMPYSTIDCPVFLPGHPPGGIRRSLV